MDKEIAYLDYNATTPVDAEVLETMLPYFNERFGNASSLQHFYGWDAEEAVSLAREQVAALVGSSPNEIIFTSGATESINLAIKGYFEANKQDGNHIITLATEHKAVLDTCLDLEKKGAKVTYMAVDSSGLVNLKELENSITDSTSLIAIMLANNETGVIQPIKEIGSIAVKKGIPVFSDVTQAAGKISVDLGNSDIAVAAFSSHKLYGPKGVGALYVSKDSNLKISPGIHGGNHERGYRSGTLNVPGIVGFGKACELCRGLLKSETQRLHKLRNTLENGLSTLGHITINGHSAHRLPHVTNVSFDLIDGTKLIRSLKGIAVSQGSACTSAVIEPSHVLKAMKISDTLALSSLRISLGRFTSPEEIDRAVSIIKKSIEKLRLHKV